MDGRDHVGIGGNIILDAGDFRSVIEKALHLLFGAAIPELQVVEHGVVLLREALVRVFDAGHVRAHLVGIVGHVGDGHVGVLRRLLGVTTEGGNQSRGEARHRLHVLVGGNTGGFVCVVRIILHSLRRVFEERINAAYQLFILCVGFDDFLAHRQSCGAGGSHGRTHRHKPGFQTLLQGFAQLGAVLFGFLYGIVEFFGRISTIFRSAFIAFQLVLCGDDFALKRPDLFLGGFTASELFLDLLLRLAQGFQLFFCRADCAGQNLLFLREKIGVARIELQELVDALEFLGKRVGLGFYTLQRLSQFGGIAANLDCDSFEYLIGHELSLLPKLLSERCAVRLCLLHSPGII